MKQFIALLVICASILGIVYGSYKPYKKAKLYVAASRNVRSYADLMTLFGAAITYPSPIGHDEVLRFTTNEFMNVIAEGKSGDEVAQTLTNFIHTYVDPKIESKEQMNYMQLVLMLGTLHTYKWKQFHKQEDFNMALKYFLEGYSFNHDRPQFLIGLLELYQLSGQEEKANAIKAHIYELWGGI